MDREGFRNRLKQYKKAREENPGLKYWEWKAQPAEKNIPKYDEGGEVGKKNAIPTLEEYIAQQIAAKKAAALEKSRNRTSIKAPMIPNPISEEEYRASIIGNIERREKEIDMYLSKGFYTHAEIAKTNLDRLIKKYVNGYEPLVPGPNCLYNASDCYDFSLSGNQTFAANPSKYGFKKADKGSMEPGDIVQDVRGGTPIHAMIYDSKDTEGNLLFNYARGNAYTDMKHGYVKQGKYPLPIKDYDVYKYVGTPADSIQWINDYRKIYGFADGGEVGDNDFMKLFGKQVSYKPEETSWWSNVKNWWNDLTGMKNYAYGNCATTPGGKHTKECAHYSNSILRNQGYKNIVGDAWTRAANSGMKKITSGYDGLTKPSEWDESDAHDYLQSAAENFANKVDTTALNPYDVVGLYYPDSPNTKKAFEQGRWGETQTHTGHITIGKDGTHYVVHNVGGHLKMNKLADMLTGDYDYLPVSAYRPKK